MIITVIENIVNSMNSNGKDYLFDIGWAAWLNISVDEFDNEKGLVLLDSDSPYKFTTTQGGRIIQGNLPSLFFAFKSEIEWTPLEHDTNCITPATNAITEFISRCQSDNDNIESITVVSDGISLFNEKDVNISGIFIQFEIVLRNNPSVCIT